MKPIGKVVKGRIEILDDYWGDSHAIIEIDRSQFDESDVRGLDAVEGTPILDIKPVIKEFLPDKKSIREPKWAEDLMCAYFKNENDRAKQ